MSTTTPQPTHEQDALIASMARAARERFMTPRHMADSRNLLCLVVKDLVKETMNGNDLLTAIEEILEIVDFYNATLTDFHTPTPAKYDN